MRHKLAISNFYMRTFSWTTRFSKVITALSKKIYLSQICCHFKIRTAFENKLSKTFNLMLIISLEFNQRQPPYNQNPCLKMLISRQPYCSPIGSFKNNIYLSKNPILFIQYLTLNEPNVFISPKI